MKNKMPPLKSMMCVCIVLLFCGCNLKFNTKSKQYFKIKGGTVNLGGCGLDFNSMYIIENRKKLDSIKYYGIIFRLNVKLISDRFYSPAAINGIKNELLSMKINIKLNSDLRKIDITKKIIKEGFKENLVSVFDSNNNKITFRHGDANWNNIEAENDKSLVHIVNDSIFVDFVNNFKEEQYRIDEVLFFFPIDSMEFEKLLLNGEFVEIELLIKKQNLRKFKMLNLRKDINSPSIEYYEKYRKDSVLYYLIKQ